MDDTSNLYDPALIQQLVAMASAPDQQAMMRQRMQYGREDSQTPMPKGMQVGGTYVAASPFEHLASALQRGVGLAQQRGAMGGMENLIGQQQQGRSTYADALMRALASQQPAGPLSVEAPQMVPMG